MLVHMPIVFWDNKPMYSVHTYRFLRSVSYREFTRLVYGLLGNKRIPLPACAYHMIRKTFPLENGEEATGFIDTD